MLRRPNPHHRTCPVTPHAHPLARRFFRLLAVEGVALSDVAARAGLGVATLVKWKHRHSPTVAALEAALNVIGYRLTVERIPETKRRTAA